MGTADTNGIKDKQSPTPNPTVVVSSGISEKIAKASLIGRLDFGTHCSIIIIT